MPDLLKVILPYPPTVNTYWRRAQGRTILSKEAREFHQRAKTAWLLERFATGVRTLGDVPVKVRIVVHPPDRRRRDLDNVLKAILDSLEKSDVIEDDRQVRRLLVEFGQTVKGGKVVVEIERLPGVEKQRPAIVS